MGCKTPQEEACQSRSQTRYADEESGGPPVAQIAKNEEAGDRRCTRVWMQGIRMSDPTDDALASLVSETCRAPTSSWQRPGSLD